MSTPDLPRPDRIEDYGLIGNLHTAALVHRNGAIDWLCLPRFDSPACFARLLGENQNGYWQIAPVDTTATITRRYEDETLILVTRFETSTGIVELTDFMPIDPQHGTGQLVRIATGIEGTVDMQTTLFLRFDYGSVVPWVRKQDHKGIYAVSGPQGVRIETRVPLEGENMHTVGKFTIAKGDRVPFVMSWHSSYYPEPARIHSETELRRARRWWRRWAGTYEYHGELRAPVIRSLITLRAMTSSITGGIVAAVTTSLPEKIGGVRNWDYRYCWVRDAAFTLNAFLRWGHKQEIISWKAWLLRAAAGKPEDLQIMYSITGERRLTELELPWLKGFQDSAPVRIGNAASQQRQLDVYGELIDAFSLGRRSGIPPTPDSWAMGMSILKFIETIWREPDSGLWEERGEPRHFTYSKIMAWVAFDRAIAAAESHAELKSDVDAWKKTRQEIFDDVCEKGFDKDKNSFVQSYGSDALDASLLRVALVGFLPPEDPRVIGTVEAIQRELMEDGMVLRYRGGQSQDGLPPGEGTFVACSFWLAEALIAIGRREEARALFDRLLTMCNDLGLLAEEYDTAAKRQMGNFPQAFSHVGLLHTARSLIDPEQIGRLAR